MTTTMTTVTNKVQIPDRLYFRIGDVADLLGIKPYVLRYWESEFPIISPQKSLSGQRVYRRSDVETVLMIKHLLYEERYSIEGAKKRIKDLRREGELRVFKDTTVAGLSDESERSPEKTSESAANPRDPLEIRELAGELCALSQTPMSDLFKF